MTSAQKSVYSINDEATAPLNEQTNSPTSETKQAGCSTRKKLFGVGVSLIALAAGAALGYYYGFYKKASSKPSYSYKRVIMSNSTSSTSSGMKPLSLSSNNE